MTRESGRRAGWYDDPSTELSDHESDAARLRYWDGVKWSPHTVPKPTADEVDQVSGHTVRLRAPDEHTTVPLPPEPVGSATSGGWFTRTLGHARRAQRMVGGHR